MDVLRRISRKNCRAVESRESNQRKKWLLFLCLKMREERIEKQSSQMQEFDNDFVRRLIARIKAVSGEMLII